MTAPKTRCVLLTMAVCCLLGALLGVGGCAAAGAGWRSLRGEGFDGWSQSLGTGLRGDSDGAKPSGFFTDGRSDEIEKSLGGF